MQGVANFKLQHDDTDATVYWFENDGAYGQGMKFFVDRDSGKVFATGNAKAKVIVTSAITLPADVQQKLKASVAAYAPP